MFKKQKKKRTNQHEDTTPQIVGRVGKPVLRQRSKWKVSKSHLGLLYYQLCSKTTEQTVNFRGKFVQCFHLS